MITVHSWNWSKAHDGAKRVGEVQYEDGKGRQNPGCSGSYKTSEEWVSIPVYPKSNEKPLRDSKQWITFQIGF